MGGGGGGGGGGVGGGGEITVKSAKTSLIKKKIFRSLDFYGYIPHIQKISKFLNNIFFFNQKEITLFLFLHKNKYMYCGYSLETAL